MKLQVDAPEAFGTYTQRAPLPKQEALRQARPEEAVPEEGVPEEGPLYEQIAVVGHSLGSVVAYDSLNRAFNTDEMNKHALRVADRTALLLTFGSPLDKTAYIFRRQNQTLSNVREALAASVQPLIRDYARFRRFPWVNVHSSRDLIGSPLDFYDSEQASGYSAARHVRNLSGPHARIPLVAHVEHWETPLVFDTLVDEVIAPAMARAAAQRSSA